MNAKIYELNYKIFYHEQTEWETLYCVAFSEADAIAIVPKELATEKDRDYPKEFWVGDHLYELRAIKSFAEAQKPVQAGIISKEQAYELCSYKPRTLKEFMEVFPWADNIPLTPELQHLLKSIAYNTGLA